MESAQKFLSKNNFKIAGIARDGASAVEQASLLFPDMVLMDISMKGMNGLEATKQIKKMQNPPKVIIVTLHDELEYFSEAVNSGADGFLSKGDFVAKILPLIEKVFSQPEGEEILK